MKPIRVGLIGAKFIAGIHLEALRSVPYTEVVAVCSATATNARAFAARHGIPRWFTDYRKMYELPDLDMVVLGLPNDLHCDAVVAAAAAGKHVVCEKPLCLNLAEADTMIAACRQANVKLMYAEEPTAWAWAGAPAARPPSTATASSCSATTTRSRSWSPSTRRPARSCGRPSAASVPAGVRR